MNDRETDELIAAARAAWERAYAPYSKFQVGAALQTNDGRIFPGCNVENASYGLCFCAERTAVVSAIAAGVAGRGAFRALAVVADTPEPVSPCGACRQVLVEFAPDLIVILTNLKGERRVTTARELLPGFFGPEDLNAGAAPTETEAAAP